MYVIVGILSLLVSFFLYGNILNGDFVYDDVFFSGREDLHHISSLFHIWTQPYQPQNTETGGGFYRPVWVASLALNFIVFGSGTVSFHVVNTILYAAVLFTLFFLILKLFNNRLLASFSTLFFAFLPIHTEAVANIKSRDELLSTLFLLISWYVFLSAQNIGKKIFNRKIWLSAFIFFLALLSKENVVLMPILFFVVWYIDKKPKINMLIKGLIPFLIFYISYFPLRMIALGQYAFVTDKSDFIMNQLANEPVFTRIATAFYILFLYVLKTFIPYNLSASYDYAVIPTLSNPFISPFAIFGIVISILIIIFIFLRKTPRELRIGLLFFVFSYLVISKIFFAKGAIFGERLIFLSTIGISILVGWTIFELYKWNRYLALSGLFFALIIYSMIIIPRNNVWANERHFFEQMVIDSPHSVQARNGLAQGYFKMGKLNDAYIQASEGYKIYKNHPPLVNLLGKLEFIKGDYSKSYAYFVQAIKLNNNNFENHQFYCYSLTKLGKYKESIAHIEVPFEKNSDDNELRFIMAVNLYKMGHRKEALLTKYNWIENSGIEEREKILAEF